MAFCYAIRITIAQALANVLRESNKLVFRLLDVDFSYHDFFLVSLEIAYVARPPLGIYCFGFNDALSCRSGF
jgi:hypothetical protein